MDSAPSKLFPQSDIERISAAVRDAELRTSGEIVPYVVERSDVYEEAEWRGGAGLAVIALGAVVLYDMFSGSWMFFGPGEIALMSLIGGLLGMGLVRFVPPLKRILAGSTLIQHRVEQRAASAFIEEEVFSTRERTGILLFVSRFEHKVLVVGDAGINSKVEKKDWEGIVGRIVQGISSGKAADGMVDAIRESGALLERAGVAIRSDDTNELSNEVRQRR